MLTPQDHIRVEICPRCGRPLIEYSNIREAGRPVGACSEHGCPPVGLPTYSFALILGTTDDFPEEATGAGGEYDIGVCDVCETPLGTAQGAFGPYRGCPNYDDHAHYPQYEVTMMRVRLQLF